MYIDISTRKKNGKTYTRALIRESYREGWEVKKRTIANISNCPREEIEAIRLALKYKNNLSELVTVSEEMKLKQGISVGSVFTLNTLCNQLGITKALGNSREAKLTLWMIIARIINPASKLATVRMARQYAACDVLDLNSFNEDDLYYALDWLYEKQEKIEKRLFRQKYPNSEIKPKLFLYDVTSSYLEGTENELAEFGYDRDGKKGKKQIVIGLLSDKNGEPLATEVFEGNTKDNETFYNQIEKIAKRFGCKEVTMVGDRGMIKSNQIKALFERKENFHYITAITKPQIRTLINQGVIQTGLFDDKLCEVESDRIRYVLRKNPVRVKEIGETRESKLNKIRDEIAKENRYLLEHPRALESTAVSKVTTWIKKLKIDGFVECICNNRVLSLKIDDEKLEEISLLDGCYVIKTDLPKDFADKDTVHERYKDLKYVESAFRTMKTGLLEIRPLFLRNGERTRAHVFMVMLAYKVTRFIAEMWRNLDVTVEEGIDELSNLCCIEVRVRTVRFNSIPEPSTLGKRLLKELDVVVPHAIRAKGVNVATRQSLEVNRK